MKVVKDATNDPEWTSQFTCKGCNSVLEIGRDDIQHYAGQEYPIYRPGGHFVECPVCKDFHNNEVHLDALPKGVQKYVMLKKKGS